MHMRAGLNSASFRPGPLVCLAVALVATQCSGESISWRCHQLLSWHLVRARAKPREPRPGRESRQCGGQARFGSRGLAGQTSSGCVNQRRRRQTNVEQRLAKNLRPCGRCPLGSSAAYPVRRNRENGNKDVRNMGSCWLHSRYFAQKSGLPGALFCNTFVRLQGTSCPNGIKSCPLSFSTHLDS